MKPLLHIKRLAPGLATLAILGMQAGLAHAQSTISPSSTLIAAAARTSGDTNTATTGATPLPPYVSDRSYLIAPDDDLAISIVNHPETQPFEQVVDPDGTINYPHADAPIKVVGKTAQQVEAIVTRLLTGNGNPNKAYYLHPEVRVYVRSRQERDINVIGTSIHSLNGSKLALKEGWRVFDALAAVGFSTDRPELFDAHLIRPTAIGTNDAPTNSYVIDLDRVFAQYPTPDPDVPNSIGNIVVLPYDTIMVNDKPDAEVTVTVVGMVAKPGLTPIPRDRSIATLLGEVQPDPAALLSGAILRRDGHDIAIDLSRWFIDAKVNTDIKLVPGDRLTIPQNKRTYAIYGAVPRGGTVMYPDDRKVTLMSAWADAGGNTEGLETNDVKVIRPSPTGGKPLVMDVNVKEILKEGKMQDDIPIEPGDIIYMPASKRPGFSFHDVLGYIGIVNFIPTLYFLFHQ